MHRAIDLEMQAAGLLPQALAGLPSPLRAAVGEPRPCSIVYLDTPDWRLGRGGSQLTLQLAPRPRSLALWRGEVVLATSLRGRAPAFAHDIEAAAMRDALLEACGDRRIRQVLRLGGSVTDIEIRDDVDKLVVRGRRWQLGTVDGGDGAPALPERLELHAVRGYDEQLALAASGILGTGACSADGFAYQRALAAFGGLPDVDSGKVEVDLLPEEPLRSAVGRIVARLVAIMTANEAGTAAAIDPEFLHDFRVAARRLRALLSQVPAAFDAGTAAHLREDLRWLGGITGPARDADVFALDLRRWQRHMVAAEVADLQPLLQLTRRQQQRRRKAVARALGDDRYRQLMERLRAAAVAPSPPDDVPVPAVARERLLRAFQRVRRRGGEAVAGSSESLHRLRLACKKLRYLLEFFQALLDAQAATAIVSRLKALQDELGRIQDAAVQELHLQDAASLLARRRPVPERTLMLIGRLQERLQRDARGALAQVERRLGELDAITGDADLRGLLGEPAGD